jgi:alkylation response protein AidB-like acyl-CoA dehydrogenase
MAKLKSTKVADEAIYSCFANVRWLWVYGREYPLARLLRDSRLGPIGGNSEILKEILSKMIIDKQNYASGEIAI